jgi:tripartite-type tricarboxylate transporter receptor subunit TctC
VRLLTAVIAFLLSASCAVAANYDCAQVRLIVPYAAGGATDVAARVVAERLEKALGRAVVIETRTGATGNVGTAAAISSKPDGCTLLVNAAVIATFPYSFSKLNYDPIKDLAPIGGIGVTPTLIVTASANPPNDLKELVAWSKTKPEGLTFGTAGYGLLQHLAVEQIAQREGAKFVHAPYRGGAQAVTDLITARVDFGSFSAGSVGPLVREGKLKAIAVVQDKRSPLAPDVRTLPEQELPSLDGAAHFMLFAPAATPKDVVAMLSSELRKITGDPALKERFASIWFEPTPTSAEEAAAILHRTGETWAPLIKRLGIKLD